MGGVEMEWAGWSSHSTGVALNSLCGELEWTDVDVLQRHSMGSRGEGQYRLCCLVPPSVQHYTYYPTPPAPPPRDSLQSLLSRPVLLSFVTGLHFGLLVDIMAQPALRSLDGTEGEPYRHTESQIDRHTHTHLSNLD